MPFSSSDLKEAIFQHIRTVASTFLPHPYKILEVGPGYGVYGRHLSDLGMDAVEIYKPYTNQYNLREYYKNVFVDNILSFNYDGYDYIIMGDVLEHIPTQDAQRLITDITLKGIKCLVAVPFLASQDAVNGVESEIHHQEDLTPRVMKSRYPELELFLSNNLVKGYAYYTNYHKWIK